MEEVKIQGGKVLDACNEVQIQVGVLVIILILTICGKNCHQSRVAEVGSFLARAKMATKVYVSRVFAIFDTNASFLRVIANLQILI